MKRSKVENSIHQLSLQVGTFTVRKVTSSRYHIGDYLLNTLHVTKTGRFLKLGKDGKIYRQNIT